MAENSETTRMLRQWFETGGSAMPVIRRLIADGEPEQATVIARLALRNAQPADRDELLGVLAELTNAPAGWAPALRQFASSPSVEAWDELMRFVGEEDFYQRLKYTVVALIGFGCDGEVLFECVSRIGFIPELYDLAQSGKVDPETIVARANGSPAEASWLGLAAQAAFARGDRAATVRHLWRASQLNRVLAFASVMEIREKAGEELNAELDRAGIPGREGS